MQLEKLIEKLPEQAKDMKTNVMSVLTEEGAPDLTKKQIYQIAVASAYTLRDKALIAAILADARDVLSPAEMDAAKVAATIMAMNNIYYRFVHISSEQAFASLPAKLRMTAVSTVTGDKIGFELSCIAVSAINACGKCLDAHTQAITKAGASHLAIQSAVRIASVLNAVVIGLTIAENN